MSKEYPLLCCDSVVRAVLDGRQTQDRRPITRLREFGPVTEFGVTDTPGYDWHFRDKCMRWHDIPNKRLRSCAPWAKGNVLWVREAWAEFESPDKRWIRYRAEEENWSEFGSFGTIKWRPSIHMPRRACRLTLEVLDVRVERLISISEADAKAEGCVCRSWESAAHDYLWGNDEYAANVFSGLWDSLYAAKGYGWDQNPWVFATAFRRIDQ